MFLFIFWQLGKYSNMMFTSPSLQALEFTLFILILIVGVNHILMFLATVSYLLNKFLLWIEQLNEIYINVWWWMLGWIEVYSINHYVIKFDSDLRQDGGFLCMGTSVFSKNDTDCYDITKLLLIVVLNTITSGLNWPLSKNYINIRDI